MSEVFSAGEGSSVALLTEFFHGFSGPFYAFDDVLLGYATIEHGRATITDFLGKFEAWLQAASPSVLSFLKTASIGQLDYQSLWSPEFGRLAACTVAADPKPDEVLDAGIGLAWRFAADGVPGSWTSRSERAEARTLSHWVLPAARETSVESTSDQFSVSLEGADGQRFRHTFPRDTVGKLHAHHCAPFPANHDEQGVLIMTQGVQDMQRWVYLRESLLPTERVSEAKDIHRRAMALMDEHSPDYAHWVRRLLRAVIPLETRRGGINSGSSREEPGVIHASIDCPVEGYAEMLVHEVSHQHVYALSRLGPLDDGSDKTMYYSPVKGTGRPVGMVLLAYHAFANVVLLGRQCRRCGSLIGSDYFERNEAFLVPKLDVLEQGLRASVALTPIGTALWEPLAARLEATR